MNKLIVILKGLPEFYELFQDGDIYTVKLMTNLIKATFLVISPNGKNFDMTFVQRIGRVWCPSKKIHKEPREEILETIKDVPLGQIEKKYNWIMRGNYEPEIV